MGKYKPRQLDKHRTRRVDTIKSNERGEGICPQAIMKNKILGTFLSTPAEVHALVAGIYYGLTEWKGIDPQHFKKNKDVKKEKYYAYGGYILGTIIRWGMIITVGMKIFTGI